MDLQTAVKKFKAANPNREVVGYLEKEDGFILLANDNGAKSSPLFLVNNDGVRSVTPMMAGIDFRKMKFYSSK